MSKQMPLQERCDRLNTELNDALDREEALRAEVAALKEELSTLLAWINGDKDTLAVLQLIAHDTRLSPETRIRAANAAVPFERPKLDRTYPGADFAGAGLNQSPTVRFTMCGGGGSTARKLLVCR